MVAVTSNSYPIWWRGITIAPPAQWSYVFEELTGPDTAEEWALGAAVFVAQTRHRTGRGPTFGELFTELLPDTRGLPAPFPEGLDFAERRRAVTGFRGHVTIEWRRRGMIGWDKDVARSLRVGHAFRERSRQRQLIRSSRPHPHPRPDLDEHPATSLNDTAAASSTLTARSTPMPVRRHDRTDCDSPTREETSGQIGNED